MHGLAILSFSRKWKSGIVPTGGICARFWSLSVGWLEFLYLLCSSLILPNTIQINFPVYDKISSKRATWLEQNTWKFCTEPLLMVYKIDWVYLLLCQCPICKTGSKDVYFKGSCLMSFEWILKHCGAINASSLINNDDLYQLPLFIAWLRFSRILQFSCLKPGGFTWVVTPCKERDDPPYGWENITFFSIKMEIGVFVVE